jgi:hypothetical protein
MTVRSIAVEEGHAMVLEAIQRRPANGHNAHMVMHGYYEKRDPTSAQAFLAAWMPSYPHQALMWGHLQWPWSLTELALGQDDLALARLLGPMLDHLPRGTPFMGLADIVALLWRPGLRAAPSASSAGSLIEDTRRSLIAAEQTAIRSSNSTACG